MEGSKEVFFADMGNEIVECGSGDHSVCIAVGEGTAVLTSSISGTEKAEIQEICGESSEHSVVVGLEAVLEELNGVPVGFCRICHFTFSDAENLELYGEPIELGCSCKTDLASAHRDCAEAWFKIKGNRTCEICGSIATNVVGPSEAEMLERSNGGRIVASNRAAVATVVVPQTFWRSYQLFNFALACMVIAFLLSWIFHFNVPALQ